MKWLVLWATKIGPIQLFLFCTLSALWLHGCWWSHVEITSIQGAVISFYWDQWHAWSRPFSFTPTDPLFSPIQPWWLLSHHCLHPPMVAQWTPVCRSLPDRLLSVKKPTARGSPFVTYPRGGWMAFSFDLYFAIFPPHTGYFSLALFRCDKVVLCLGCWIPFFFYDVVPASNILSGASL